MSEEFKQGMLAFFLGLRNKDNPYEKSDTRAEEWLQGLFASMDIFYLAKADSQDIADYYDKCSRFYIN